MIPDLECIDGLVGTDIMIDKVIGGQLPMG